MKKYEFYLFEGNQIMIDNKLPQLQKDGWELAGETSTQFEKIDSEMYFVPTSMLIPLKRELK